MYKSLHKLTLCNLRKRAVARGDFSYERRPLAVASRASVRQTQGIFYLVRFKTPV
jgi:hypothetical protein